MSEKTPDNPQLMVGKESAKKAYIHSVKFTRSRITIIVAVIVAIVALSYAFHATNKSPKDAAFEIEGKLYTKSQIEPAAQILSSSNGEPLNDSGRRLFVYYKEQKATQELGIKVPKTMIDQENAAVSKVFPQKLASTLVEVTAYHNALQDYYQTAINGMYKGYSFVFDFSTRLLPQDPQAPIAGQGDQQLIAKDKAYAKALADNYHSQVLNNKISPETLLSETQKDPLLGSSDKSIMVSALKSSKFDSATGQDWEAQIGAKSISDYVRSLSAPGIGNVELGEVTTTNSSVSPAKYAPGYYYFVDLISVQKGRTDLQNQVEQKAKTLKAVYYGI